MFHRLASISFRFLSGFCTRLQGLQGLRQLSLLQGGHCTGLVCWVRGGRPACHLLALTLLLEELE